MKHLETGKFVVRRIRLGATSIVVSLAFSSSVMAEPTTREEFVDLVGPTIGKSEQILICPSPESARHVLQSGATRGPGSTARLERQADLEKCRTTQGPFTVIDATEQQTTTDKRGKEEVVWFSLRVRRGTGPSLVGLYGWVP